MSSHPLPRVLSPSVPVAVGLVIVLALAAGGCGEDDRRPASGTAAGPATTGSRAPTATGPVNGSVRPDPTTTEVTGTATTVTGPVGEITVASGVDRRRGIRLSVRTVDASAAQDAFVEDGSARVVLTVTRDAPVAVRRRLARTSGYDVACDLGGPGTTGAEIVPTGSRDAVAVGTVRRSDPFLEPEKGRPIRDTVRACFLHLSSDPRGSTTRSYASGNPDRAYATVRFR